jgi:antibiotic biosynthesis monooxygenase (ABM) superfamily enzyme
MIVYEVRAAVDAEVADAYRAWLDPHVREILAIPGFTGAELLVEDGEAGRRVYCVRYHLADRAALEAYLRDHAPRLRADAQVRFGDRFTATRRVSELVAEYGR